jgi:exosortase/archaeosortase family protein
MDAGSATILSTRPAGRPKTKLVASANGEWSPKRMETPITIIAPNTRLMYLNCPDVILKEATAEIPAKRNASNGNIKWTPVNASSSKAARPMKLIQSRTARFLDSKKIGNQGFVIIFGGRSLTMTEEAIEEFGSNGVESSRRPFQDLTVRTRALSMAIYTRVSVPLSLRELQGRVESMKLTRIYYFVLAIAVAYLVPSVIPGVGIDYPYFFIMVIVLMAWFTMKWSSVERLTTRGGRLEVIAGVTVILGVYAYKVVTQTPLGLIDLLVIFSAIVLAFYGPRSFKLFWVPATYGIVLLLGYQIENNIPNYVALQDWMAGLMAASMRTLGVAATTSGHLVTLNSGPSTMVLDVESDCTGIQGILAFGMLSTMALMDIKPKMSRVIPLFALGFLGVFLINILRLIVVFLSFEYLGVAIGTQVHVYFGYTLFIVWVLVFWSLAFRYLGPSSPNLSSHVGLAPPAKPIGPGPGPGPGPGNASEQQ